MAPEYSSIGILSVGRVAWGREDRLAAGAQNLGAGGIAMNPRAGMCPAWSAYRAGRGALLPTKHACLRNVERKLDGAEVASQKAMLLLTGGHVRWGGRKVCALRRVQNPSFSFYDDQHMGSARRT